MKRRAEKHSFICSLFRGFCWKIFSKTQRKKDQQWENVPKKYYGKKILSPEASNDFIREALSQSNPVFIGRYGDVELKAIREFLEVQHHLRRKIPSDVLDKLSNNAGMFSTDDDGFRVFVEHMISATSHLTGLCCWGNVVEDYVVSSFGDDCALLNLDGLEGYRYHQPWMSALAGKKVLVVHPFSESINSQYFNNRTKIFKDNANLPLFQLRVLKAVQTMAGEKTPFKTWQEALLDMHRECQKIDYDIAIIGCGSYGLPLGELLFLDGKKVIQAGGVTQILFGVLGSRWEHREYMKPFISECWIRPAKSEKPKNASKVENGCYW